MRRGTNIKWSEAADSEFQYIDLTSVDRATRKISGTETITQEGAPSRAQQIVREGDVLFGTTRPMLKRYCIVPAEFDGQIASTGYCVLRADRARLIPNFLFHLLGTAEFYAFVEANERGAGYPAIPDSIVKEFRIPVPPLEVQSAIATILDNFTELEAELEARRHQYAHYRDSLLTFSEAGGVRRIPMGEVTTRIASGMNKSRTATGVFPVYGSTGQLGYSDQPAYSGDALLVARVGAYAGLVKAVRGEFDVSDNTLVVSPAPEWDMRFAFHQLTHMNLNQYALGGGQPLVTGGLLKGLEIALPPLDEQRRIASILDNFDALVNDLSVGLPAELIARRKQYEYYRDRLLTFAEVAA